MTRPRALLLDDQGELDRVSEALRRIGVEPMRRSGPDVADGLPMPHDLLITSGKRAMNLPTLSVDGATGLPIWICIHTQDFHPLRERLRNLGVHFLVQAAVDDRTLDLVLGQMLHNGNERRRSPRLPIGCEVRWHWKARSDEKGQLLDLSEDGMRVLMQPELPKGAMVTVQLPGQLTAQSVEIEACVLRSEPSYQAEGVMHAAVLLFPTLEPETQALISSLVRGERIGTRITPLAPRYVDGADIPDWEEMASESDRRQEQRRSYESHVDAFGDGGPVGALGRDLSSSGIRLAEHPDLDLEIGSRVTLALHGAGRDEPLVVAASVSRRDADGSLALAFDELRAEEKSVLDSILAALPAISALDLDDDGDDPDGRLFVTEVQAA